MDDKKEYKIFQKETTFLAKGETSQTFGHTNANFSMLIDRGRNQFKKNEL